MASAPTSRARSEQLPQERRLAQFKLLRRAATVSLLMLLSAFIVLEGLLPLGSAVQIGSDDGFELAKATLCVKGHKLYSEIWNDQPPLHTFLISEALTHLSYSILLPRLVTIASACLLLGAIFLIAFRIAGLLAAVVATALLIASPEFLVLSASCMLEIPSLALAIAAVCLLLTSPANDWNGIPISR